MPSAINYHGTGKGNDTRLPWCNIEDCTKWTSDTFMVGHSVDYASTVWEQKEDKILSTQTNVQQLPWPNMVASKYCKISRMRKTCTGPGINIAFKYQEIINDTYDQSSFSRSIYLWCYSYCGCNSFAIYFLNFPVILELSAAVFCQLGGWWIEIANCQTHIGLSLMKLLFLVCRLCRSETVRGKWQYIALYRGWLKLELKQYLQL
jgi:hypothetical protein